MKSKLFAAILLTLAGVVYAQQPAAKTSAEPKPAESGMTAINRAALPPLDVEVVTGDSHRTVHPGSNVTKVEIPKSNAKTAEFTAKIEAPRNAAELERVPAAAAHPSLGSFDGSYPLLAQQMQVQGSVVLQALIGVDGVIQNLRVLSGERLSLRVVKPDA